MGTGGDYAHTLPSRGVVTHCSHEGVHCFGHSTAAPSTPVPCRAEPWPVRAPLQHRPAARGDPGPHHHRAPSHALALAVQTPAQAGHSARGAARGSLSKYAAEVARSDKVEPRSQRNPEVCLCSASEYTPVHRLLSCFGETSLRALITGIWGIRTLEIFEYFRTFEFLL